MGTEKAILLAEKKRKKAVKKEKDGWIPATFDDVTAKIQEVFAKESIESIPEELEATEEKRGRPKGSPKTGGRVKGTLNKRSFDARALAESRGVDPLEILLDVAAGDWEALGYDLGFITKVNMGIEYEEDVITLDHRITAATQAAKYIYPQLKSVELTGKDGANLFAQRLLNAQSRVGNMNTTGTIVGDAQERIEDGSESRNSEDLDDG